jgi:hypothetical protein
MEFGESPERYNVVWDSPSKDQHGSVPLGNGATGVNAWIEPNGDLVFYISRTDSWGDNGRLLMKALQAMILQTDGRKIFIAPAWPKEWNAEFKLHAPYETVIEGKVENGVFTHLEVTPKSRGKDVVIAAEVDRLQ